MIYKKEWYGAKAADKTLIGIFLNSTFKQKRDSSSRFFGC
jgi:hypothetical protein